MIIKRLNLYQTISEFETSKHTLLYPCVSYIREDGNVHVLEYEKYMEYLKLHFLTFTAEEDGSSIGLEKLSTNQTLEYSIDTVTWNAFDTTTTIPLNNGDKVYVRGILSADNSSSNYTQFKMSGKIAASGNCNAIWNYKDLNALLKVRCGYRMFYGCTSLTEAPELPATTLADCCYSYMFYGCTSLVEAPKLPATVLAVRCYSYMFYGCTKLTQSPELPATILAMECYLKMFNNCFSLTTAPELPATTLNIQCYMGMFSGCTSLTKAPELHATTLKTQCYMDMFSGCTSLTKAPELPATVLVDRCYSHMFKNCTNLNYIKCLATDISATWCTYGWVNNVSPTGTFIKHTVMNNWTGGVNGIPEGWVVENAEVPCVTFTAEEDNSSIGLERLKTNQTLEYSLDLSNWSNMNTSTNISLNNGDKVYIRGILSSNDSTNSFTKFKMTGKIAASGNCNALWNYNDLEAPLKDYCGYGMFSNCTSLTTAPELPATVLADNCYRMMFSGCSSLTTAPEILPATVLADNCYSAMFQLCISLTKAPELPATTLADCCYRYMFNMCTSLNYIKCLATDISATWCTYGWVSEVSSTGTFAKHPDMNNWTSGDNGIPEGWTVENYAEQ